MRPWREVATTDSAAVSTALASADTSTAMSTNLKAEGFADVKTIVVAAPIVVENTAPAPADSGSSRAHSAGMFLAAIATALFTLF